MTNFSKLFLLGLLIAFSYNRGHCTPAAKNKAEYVKQGEIPYQVSVQAGGAHLCSGALIGAQHVLTAARCFVWNGKDYNSSALGELTVVAGTSDLKSNTGRLDASVTEIIVPAGYDPSHGSAHVKDLALLKLQSPISVKNNSNIAFVNLPVSDQTYASKYAIVTGFHPLIEMNENGSYIFHEANLKLNKLETLIIHDHICKSFYPSGKIQASNLCTYAFAVNKQFYGSCKLDDGAPLVYDKVVIGISSAGTDNCGKLPSIFTKVSSYAQLIYMAQRGDYTNEMKVIHIRPSARKQIRISNAEHTKTAKKSKVDPKSTATSNQKDDKQKYQEGKQKDIHVDIHMDIHMKIHFD